MTATATEYKTIMVTHKDGVATLTFNRPDSLNAISDELTTELIDALKTLERDKSVQVIIMTGDGRAFSSGQDLSELKEKYVPGHIPELGDDLRRRYNPIVMRIRTMKKLVIAAVNGVAAGAGCSLALACDLRIISDKASFIEVFVNVGLIPDSASTFILPRLIGLGRAMELCCSGRKVTAEEAMAIGLVNKVVPSDALATEAQAMAAQLATMPSQAIALTKRLLNEALDNDLPTQLEAEAFAQETAGKTRDHFEGVTAFLEKRTPNFNGS